MLTLTARKQINDRIAIYDRINTLFVFFVLLGGRAPLLPFSLISGTLLLLVVPTAPITSTQILRISGLGIASRFLLFSSVPAGVFFITTAIASSLVLAGGIPWSIFAPFVLGSSVRFYIIESLSATFSELFSVSTGLWVLSSALMGPFILFWIGHLVPEQYRFVIAWLFSSQSTKESAQRVLARVANRIRLSPFWALLIADLYLEKSLDAVWQECKEAASIESAAREGRRRVERTFEITRLCSLICAGISGAVVILERCFVWVWRSWRGALGRMMLDANSTAPLFG